MAGDQNYHGGPAFPCSNEQFTYGNPQAGDAAPGMTKREYMATAILAGLLSQEVVRSNAAIVAVEWADALLLELAKP